MKQMPLEEDETWWGAAFRYAVIQAGLAPAEFWRLSLPELAALAAASGPNVLDVPGRSELESMMMAHPDRKVGQAQGMKQKGTLNAAKR